MQSAHQYVALPGAALAGRPDSQTGSPGPHRGVSTKPVVDPKAATLRRLGLGAGPASHHGQQMVRAKKSRV